MERREKDMSTTIRSEISKKNIYWIERHRYYELKHFCLQYPLWKKAYSEIDGLCRQYDDPIKKTSYSTSPTEKLAEDMLYYSERMNMVERAAFDTDPSLSDYILKAVTRGYSYDYLKAKLEIPCCREVYYQMYRKFFYILNLKRK